MSTPALNPLVTKIRAAHPGAYDDMDDAALTKAVLAKYPQYSDLARPDSPMPGSPATQPMNYGKGGLDATPGTEVLPQLGKLGAGALRGIYSVSAPGVAEGFASKHFPKQTADVEDTLHVPQELRNISPTKESVPNAVVGMTSEMGQPDALPQPGGARPKPAPAASSGMFDRVLDVAKRRVKDKIPGMKAANDLQYILADKPSPSPPEAPAPQLPWNWGKGEFGTPVDKWGTRIESPGAAGSMAESVAAPPASRAALGRQLDQPLRESVGAPPPPQPGMPVGMTPVQSSALKGYRYDPGAQEMHVMTNDGTTYVHGDVAPEQAQAFQTAPSKGQAWQDIRNNSTLVRKVPPGGKGINVKPAIKLRSASPDDEPPNDLTEILTRSLKEAAKKK